MHALVIPHLLISFRIPSIMQLPKLHDVEGSWEALGLDWDFIHARTLVGSIRCCPSLYGNVFHSG
jgi:hypothetical protein